MEEIVKMIGGFPMEQSRVAQELIEIGHQQGHQQGMDAGRLGECKSLLRRLVVRRFSVIPDWLEQWLPSQSVPEPVEQIVEALFDVHNLDDLKGLLPPVS
jgi:predicted transposase YdaD